MLVEAFIAKLAVEAFDERVFDRLAGSDESQRAIREPRIVRLELDDGLDECVARTLRSGLLGA
jgi:hypothetical protein